MGFWCGGWDGFVCLWLSSSGTETVFWTRPHMIRPAHAALISSLVGFIAAPWRLSASRHTNVAQNVYFRAQWGWGGGVAHSTFLFTKQFVCDCVNVLRLIQATAWTSGVHSSSDQSLSHSRPSTSAVLTAQAYDDMWAVALKFLTHTHTHTSQSYSGVFFFHSPL